MDLVRLGLERGRTADDALDAITAALAEHGQGGSGEHGHDEPYFSSFLIADARGGWVLETSAPHVGRAPGRRRLGDLEPHHRSRPTGRAHRPTSRPAPTSTAGAHREIPTSIADHRLADNPRVHRTRPNAADDDRGRRGRDPARPRQRPLGRARSTDADADTGAQPAPADRREPTTGNITVCMHVRGYQATTASLVVDLRVDAPPRAWACLGQSVRRRLRALLPARGADGARAIPRSGSGSPGSATGSRPSPARVATVRAGRRAGRARALGRRRRRVRAKARRAPSRARATPHRATQLGRRRAHDPRRLTSPSRASASTSRRRTSPGTMRRSAVPPTSGTFTWKSPAMRRCVPRCRRRPRRS